MESQGFLFQLRCLPSIHCIQKMATVVRGHVWEFFFIKIDVQMLATYFFIKNAVFNGDKEILGEYY
jgi:hypothetical protein